MYSFPHIAYFNVMADMRNTMFAKTHFFDVCSDENAAADAQELLRETPTYIVWMDVSEETWTIHEKLFRNGAPSGQRELVRSYEKLINSGKYELLWEGTIDASDPLYLWRLKE